jgi:hypothetical protein
LRPGLQLPRDQNRGSEPTTSAVCPLKFICPSPGRLGLSPPIAAARGWRRRQHPCRIGQHTPMSFVVPQL